MAEMTSGRALSLKSLLTSTLARVWRSILVVCVGAAIWQEFPFLHPPYTLSRSLAHVQLRTHSSPADRLAPAVKLGCLDQIVVRCLVLAAPLLALLVVACHPRFRVRAYLPRPPFAGVLPTP